MQAQAESHVPTLARVRNLRPVGGIGVLRLGLRSEAFRAVEVADHGKPGPLHAYLERRAFEVGCFFEGPDQNASLDDLRGVAPGLPVFRIESR